MRKLGWTALGVCAALALACYAVPERLWLILAAGCAVLGLAGLMLPERMRLRAAVFFFAACAGFLWSRGYAALLLDPAEALAGEEMRVSARIADYPERTDEYTRLTLRLTQDGLPHLRVYVYDYDAGEYDLRPGDEVEAELGFLSARTRYGDESAYYYAKGIQLRAKLSGGLRLTGRWGGSFLYLPKALGRAVAEKTQELFPDTADGFMTALLTGDKDELYDDGGYTHMKIAGLAHVVAVSGMHLSFLVGAVRLITGRRRRTAFICAPVTLVFMAMTGFTPSVVRAGIMLLIMLIAPILRRENDAPTSLSAAALLLLAVNPMSIASVSFQLSFAAMLGLILFSSPLHERLRGIELRRGRKTLHLPQYVTATVSASLASSVLTMPLSALHFGFVSTYALLANLLCLWAVSAAFLLGYACCIAGFVLPAAGRVLALGVSVLPEYVLFAAKCVARLPFSAIYTTSNYGAWLIIFAYAVFAIAYLLRGEGRMRLIAPACACIVAFCTVTLVYNEVPDGSLTVTAIDVGQGQSIAVMQHDATALIDCGGINSPDNAGETASAYLRAQGRETIDLLILTHLHADHANGVEYLLDTMTVRYLLLPEDADDAGFSDGIITAAQENGTQIKYITEDTHAELGAVDMTVYAPLGTSDANERGLMVLGDYGDFEFLVTGDADMGTERMLTRLYTLPDIELLIVGHHGSKYSTSEELLEETTPDTAFISVGTNNYGHPTQEALDRLSEHGVEVHRTDMEGSISITVGGDNG